MKSKLYLLVVFVVFSFPLMGKILIMTYAFNKPNFIEIQNKTFKAFLKDDYEFVVFNDAKNEKLKDEITLVCEKLSLKCIEVPQSLHSNDACSSGRHADSVNFSLFLLGFDHNDIVMFLDSDMFLIKEFSVRKYMEEVDIAGWKTIRKNGNTFIYHLNPQLVFLNMNSLPNKKEISFSFISNTADTGGCTYYYLEKYPNLRVKYIDPVFDPASMASSPEIIKQIEEERRLLNYSFQFFLEKSFVHLGTSSGWQKRNQKNITMRESLFLDYVEQELFKATSPQKGL